MKVDKKELMRMAWKIRKEHYSTEFGECLKAAWSLLKKDKENGKLWVKPGIARIYKGKDFVETRTKNIGDARTEANYEEMDRVSNLVEEYGNPRSIRALRRAIRGKF